MKSAEVKPASSSKTGPGKPFFTGAGEAVQEQEQRPAFFNYGKQGGGGEAGGQKIQAKLNLGRAGDKFEKEADATADKVVMRLGTPGTELEQGMAKPPAPPIQTKCAACEDKERQQKEKDKEAPEPEKIRKKPIFDSTAEPPPAGGDAPPNDNEEKHREPEGIRRCEDCDAEKNVQKSGDESGKESTVPANIESRLNSSKGGGSPLPDGTRQKMESSFGADFSGVRVHTDSQAAQMNESLQAQAFAHGNDIYFNSGKYDPKSKEGQHLLAHELTHTVQQGAAVRKRPVPGVQKDDDDNSSWFDSVKSFGSSVASGVSDLAGDVKSGISDAAGYVKDKVSDAAGYVEDKAVDAAGYVKDKVSGAANYVEDKVSDAAGWVKEQFDELVNWIEGLIDDARNYITSTWEGVKNFASGTLDTLKEGFKALVEFYKDPLGNIASALENLDPVAIDMAWRSFLAFVEGKWTSFKSLGQGFLDQVQSLWDNISAYVDGFFNKIDGIMAGTLYEHLPDSVQSVVQTAYAGFKFAWKAVQDEWKTIYDGFSRVVNGFFKLGDDFLEKLKAIPIIKIVVFLQKFGALIKRLNEILHNPNLLIDPFIKWLVAKLKDAPGKFLSEIEKQIAKNKDKRKAANQGKMPKRYSLDDQDIALGVTRACIQKWQQMDIGSMLKDMVLSMVWPPATAKAIEDAAESTAKDIKEVWNGLYKVESLQDLWTNLLHLLDIVVILWRYLNTVFGLLYIYISIILIIGGAVLGGIFGVGAGAVPGALAGAEIAGELGEVLLVSFLAGEATNLGLQYLILATGLNTETEQETAFNKIADSIIGLVTAGILAILSAIAARIASGLMTAAKAILSKLSQLLGDAAEDVKVKPGEVHTGGPDEPPGDKGGTGDKGADDKGGTSDKSGTDDKGGTGDKGEPGDKGGPENKGEPENKGNSDEKPGDKNDPNTDPNTVENGEAPLEKPLTDSADGKRKLVMDIEDDCEVCIAPCDKIEKKYGSRMDEDTRARIKDIEDSNLSNEQKLSKLKEIEQGLRDQLTHLDEEGKLKPNQKYNMAGEYGYPAESDANGRLSRVHTDDLKLSEYKRVAHEPDTPGKLSGDHAGHLIGDRFGGSPDLDNLVSQTRDVNLSKFKVMENKWASALDQGKKVSVDIKINYDGDSVRPSSFDVSYTIEGEDPVKVKLIN